MPTYEYQCDGCQHTFEEFQSIMAAPIEKCLVCGAHVRRLIGRGVGIIFKGSGFYQTDYRSYKKQAEAEKKSTETKVKTADSSCSGPCKTGGNSSGSCESKAS